MALQKRKLGRTGLEVTVLGYGAMELRGPGAGIRNGKPLAPGQADKVLNTVLDSGINFIDTAIDYGLSEESIGHALAHRRREYYLATKCGCIADQTTVTPGQVRHLFTRQNILDGFAQSLKRMKTDYVDILQFHGNPPDDLRDDAIKTLQELKKQGKTRFIGVSTTLPDVTGLIKLGVFDTFQVPYSAIEREHEGTIVQAAKAGAGTIIRNGVGRGEPGHGLAEPARWDKWGQAKLDDLLHGMGRFEFMLRFTISHPELSSTIVGTLDAEHAKANVATASKGPLPADVYNEAKRRLAAVGVAPV